MWNQVVDKALRHCCYVCKMRKVSYSSKPNTQVSPASLPPEMVSPSARRIVRPKWHDSRFWFGTVLVLAAIVVGARLLAAADRTVEVWQVTEGVRAGSELDTGSLHPVRVHFDDGAAQERYLTADQELPADATVTRDVGPGELLPADAIGAETSTESAQLPLLVPASGFPTNLAVGDRVEVWSTPSETESRSEPAQVLDAVEVVAMSAGEFATQTSDRSVVVALAEDADVHQVLNRLAGRGVVLLRVGR